MKTLKPLIIFLIVIIAIVFISYIAYDGEARPATNNNTANQNSTDNFINNESDKPD